MGIYTNEEMEAYKAKVNKTIAKALEYRNRAFDFKTSLEQDAAFMKGCIDTLRINYPDLPPAKNLEEVEGFKKLRAAISKLNEIIKTVQEDNAEYKTIQEMISVNEATEKTLKEVMGMIEDILKEPEFADYIKSGIA